MSVRDTENLGRRVRDWQSCRSLRHPLLKLSGQRGDAIGLEIGEVVQLGAIRARVHTAPTVFLAGRRASMRRLAFGYVDGVIRSQEQTNGGKRLVS